MKRILVNLSVLLALLFCQTNYANPTGLLFNVTPSGNTLNISTVKSNHTYPIAGIKIKTSGYSIQSGCTPNANGYCVFSVSDTQPTSITVNLPTGQSTGALDVILCLNGLGPLSCQNYNHNSVVGTPRFAYVSNFVTAGSQSTLSLCAINASNGTFDSCSNLGNPSNALDNPYGVTLNSAGTKLYVANFAAGGGNNGTVSLCSINSDRTISSCEDSGVGNVFSNPVTITLNNTGTEAYVANYYAGTISLCFINPNGTFSSCEDAGAGSGMAGAWGIALNKAGTTVYLTNPSTGLVNTCSIISNGTFSGCSTLSNYPGAEPYGAALLSTGLTAYIPDGDNAGLLYGCPINANGTFGTCFNATANSQVTDYFDYSTIALNEAGTAAYIADEFYGVLFICPINTDGTFGVCTTPSFPGLPSPSAGVALAY